MERIQTQVCIVGGGPVGTGLAITLAQRGVDAIVVEKHPSPQPVPKGQNLTQRTVEHFRAWGIQDELAAARTMDPTQPSAGMTAYGSLLSGLAYPWLRRSSVAEYYAAPNMRLPQYRTEAVLRARLSQLDSARMMRGWEATAVTQTDENATVAVTSRTDGSRAVIEADYVVGADGSGSLVRRAAGITQTSADHDRRMVLAVFRSADFDEVMTRHPDVAFVNVLTPELEGYWQFFGRVDATETWFFHCPVDADATAETIDLAAILARAVGRPVAFETEYLGFWNLRFALADAYRSGRIFVAGDAAHSHPPYGGYGINSGLEDARNLGFKLAAHLQGWGGANLLDSYDAERRPVFASTRDDFIERSILDDRRFLATHHPGTAGFEAAWNARGTDAVDEVDRFEPHYEGSPIIDADGTPSSVGAHRFEAAPGHHLAPGTTDAGAELFPLLGDGFTLLHAPGTDADGFVDAAARRGIPLTVRSLSSASAARYGSALVLVRPDHYVAWVGSDDEGADDVLRRVVGA